MSLTFNPFDLLDENGGDRPRKTPPKPKPATDAPKPQQQQAASQVKAAPAKNAPAAGGASQVAGKKENDAKAKPQGDAQKPKGAGKEGAGKRSPGQPRQQQQQLQQGSAPAAVPREGGAYHSSENAADKPRERRDRDHRSHDRPNNARGRQYDRRSGTGRPANEQKKGGSGKGNWGSIEEGQEAEVAKAEGEGEKEENPAPAEGGEAAAAEPPKSPEKEYLTLDEYLANKKTKPLVGVEAPKLRAAGEGVDTTAWADYAPLEKSEDDGAPAKKKKDAKKVATNGKDDKVSVDKFFRVTMPPHEGAESRRGGGRGGKGGPFNKAGGGGGGRGRQPQAPGAQQKPGGKPKDASAVMSDQAQFPSLGGEATAKPTSPVQQVKPTSPVQQVKPTSPVQSAPAPVKA